MLEYRQLKRRLSSVVRKGQPKPTIQHLATREYFIDGSMADFRSLSAPPAFLPTPGAPVLPWEQWRKAFEVYLLASGADDLPDIRKRAVLLHCLGCEGQNVFQNLNPAGGGPISHLPPGGGGGA